MPPKRSQTTPTTNAQLPEESSDSDEGGYTIEQALTDWLYNKSPATRKSYSFVVTRFRKFLSGKYDGRDLDKLRKRHIRAFLAVLSATNVSIRPALCVIKSVSGHLAKLGVMKKDPSVSFKLPLQPPPSVERNLDSASIRAIFKIASHRRNKSTFHVLQVLTYAGMRLAACANLKRADIHRVDVPNAGASAQSSSSVRQYTYFIRVRCAKNAKTRKIYLKATIGKSLWDYAQSLSSVWLFPGAKSGHHITPTAIYCRIKTLARAIKKPEISPHWFRHFFATNALANGAPLVSVSRSMGHSSVNVTSLYLHEKPGTSVSSFIDLTSSSGDDEASISVNYPPPKVKKEAKNSV